MKSGPVKFEYDPIVFGTRTRVAYLRSSSRIFFNLQLWQLTRLQHFDQKRPTIHVWRDLDPTVNKIFVEETGSILKIGFIQPKWPHLHRAYLVTVSRVLITTVKYFDWEYVAGSVILSIETLEYEDGWMIGNQLRLETAIRSLALYLRIISRGQTFQK